MKLNLNNEQLLIEKYIERTDKETVHPMCTESKISNIKGVKKKVELEGCT